MIEHYPIGKVFTDHHLIYKVVAEEVGMSCADCCFSSSLDGCICDIPGFNCGATQRPDNHNVIMLLIGEEP